MRTALVIPNIHRILFTTLYFYEFHENCMIREKLIRKMQFLWWNVLEQSQNFKRELSTGNQFMKISHHETCMVVIVQIVSTWLFNRFIVTWKNWMVEDWLYSGVGSMGATGAGAPLKIFQRVPNQLNITWFSKKPFHDTLSSQLTMSESDTIFAMTWMKSDITAVH